MQRALDLIKKFHIVYGSIIPPWAIVKSVITLGGQHFASMDLFQVASEGWHCCHKRIATIIDPSKVKELRKYMMYTWIFLGFRSLVKSIVTDILGTANDKTPGMNAIRSQ